MLLMIDNYDSFTFNLVQYFGELGQDVKVLRNDEIRAAIRKFKEAEKCAPKWGRNYPLWGDALAKLGKADKAREQWRAAAGMDLSAADRARVSVLLERAERS